MFRAPAQAIAVFAASSLLGAALVAFMRSGPAGDPWTDGPPPSPPSGHAVVVAELFTSEGCSSCPPADSVMTTLIHDQPLPSVDVVGLGEHVDYWDHLGWRDPYSSPVFSRRQSDYGARVFKSSTMYTPQLVVDGQYEAVGSDIAAVRKVIVRAAKSPKALVDVGASFGGAGQLAVDVQIRSQPGVVQREPADVIVALAQDRLVDDVARGENRGRQLVHSAVVRSLTAIGSVAGPQPAFSGAVSLPVAASWTTPDLYVVALLQERGSRRILGAGSTRLNHPSLKETTR